MIEKNEAVISPAIAGELKWFDAPDGKHATVNAGINCDEESADFVVESMTGQWSAIGTDSSLLEGISPEEISNFESEEAAIEWCEARNAELLNPSPSVKAADAESPSPGVPEEKNSSRTLPDADVWADIREARAEEKDAESEVAAFAEDLKAAKKRHEVASERLGKLIDEAWTGQKRLPFGETLKEQTKIKIAESEAAPAPWRTIAIDSLTPTLSPGILKALSENSPSITTLGDLADWSNGQSKQHGGNNELKDIKGIGEKAAEKITIAFDAYWAANPLPKESPANAPATAPEPSGDANPTADTAAAIAEAVKVRDESQARIDAKHKLHDACWAKIVETGLVLQDESVTDEYKAWALAIVRSVGGEDVMSDLTGKTLKQIRDWTKAIAEMDSVFARNLCKSSAA